MLRYSPPHVDSCRLTALEIRKLVTCAAAAYKLVHEPISLAVSGLKSATGLKVPFQYFTKSKFGFCRALPVE